MPSTTALILLSLESIAHEIDTINRVIEEDRAAGNAEDRRLLKARVIALGEQVDELMKWLGEARLEDATN